ncbi:epithelial sodium channel subunit alpha-like [Glandiceps talaboti]
MVAVALKSVHLNGKTGKPDNCVILKEIRDLSSLRGNFTSFYNHMYGNCYTFNSGIDSDILTTNKPGPLYGLSLTLYAETSEYIGEMQPSTGFRIVLHNQDVMPFPEDEGISVSPGFATEVGVRMVTIKRKPHPYGDCLDQSDPKATENIFSHFFGTKYSIKACEKNCLMEAILEECLCADLRFKFNDDIRVCGGPADDACVIDVEERYEDDRLVGGCYCPQACSQSIYRYTVTSSQWPNNHYKDTVLQKISRINRKLKKKVKENPRFQTENVAKVTVYFEELNLERISEYAAYTSASLVSDLGGQMGLWIGMSVLTLAELVEFAFDVLRLVWSKLFNPNRPARTTVVHAF